MIWRTRRSKCGNYYSRRRILLTGKSSGTVSSVVIESKNIEALPILVEALEPGNISIIFEYDGKYNVIKKKISASALTLAKLLEVYKFTILKDANTRIPVRKPVDILEAGTWTP